MQDNQLKYIKLWVDSLKILDALTDEQAGKLFKAMYHHNTGKKLNLDPLINIAFIQFKNQFERDAEAYKTKCVVNMENGKKGGRPKNPNNPVGYSETQITQANPNNPKKKKKKKIKNKNKNNTLLESFNPKDRHAVKLIIDHREDMNKPITKRGVDMLLKKLDYYAKHNDITFDDALDFWLGEKWQGIDVDYKYPFRTVEKKEKSFAQIANEMPNPWDEHGNLIAYDDNGKRLEVLQ